MAGFNRGAFRLWNHPPPTLLDKLKYIEHENTFIVDKISHYTIPCNMHNYQTCWVRYPLWEAIADCRCNLSYHPEFRKRNGEYHCPSSKPENLPDTEGWVERVTYEERIMKRDVSETHEWVEATIDFYLARPFINSLQRKYSLGNKNGIWTFFDKDNNILSGNNIVYFNGRKEPEYKHHIPNIPIPDNCYRIQCKVSSNAAEFGSYQWNNMNFHGRVKWKFTHIRNIVSRLPLLVNTYKTLNSCGVERIPSTENIGCGKFFIQDYSRNGMVQLHDIATLRKPYYVRNKFAGSDLYFQNYDDKIVKKYLPNGIIPPLKVRIARHKQHPALSHHDMIDVLWKSDVFLRLMHPKLSDTLTKYNMVRPDVIQYSLYEICGNEFLKVGQKANIYNAIYVVPKILIGRNLNGSINTNNNMTEAARKLTSDNAKQTYRAGFGYGFNRNGRNIKGKGVTLTSPFQETNNNYVLPLILFVYLFPYKRHKRTNYRNALRCQWRMFEPPIAKGKFKLEWGVSRINDYTLWLKGKTLL